MVKIENKNEDALRMEGKIGAEDRILLKHEAYLPLDVFKVEPIE